MPLVSQISDQNCVRNSHYPHVNYVPRAFIFPDLNTLIISSEPYRLKASPLCNTFPPILLLQTRPNLCSSYFQGSQA
jgi:hypothetical protein